MDSGKDEIYRFIFSILKFIKRNVLKITKSSTC